jgi:hypothetical protein
MANDNWKMNNDLQAVKKGSLFLFSVCVIVRILTWFIYEPVTYNDTPGYAELASQIGQLDFTNYDGIRTPVYPLLILLSGGDFKVVWLLQSVLGLCVSLMLFSITFHQTRNTSLSVIIGLSYTLALNQLFFEANILAETVTTFLLVLSLFLLVRLQDKQDKRMRDYILLGIVVALAGLTRPLLLFLAPFFIFYLFFVTDTFRSNLKSPGKLLGFIVPAFIILFGWCFFNKATVGHFGPTTATGLHLSQHVGAFIELAPDEYADLRDTYLKYRERQISDTGSHKNTVWPVYQELRKRTGISMVELSRELSNLSIKLIVDHPDLYLKGVAIAWLDFWMLTDYYWDLSKIRLPGIARPLEMIWHAEVFILSGVHVLFLLIGLYQAYRVISRRGISITPFGLMVIIIVMCASVVQALMEYGDNARYSIPFQPLIAYTVISAIWSALFGKKQQPIKGAITQEA